MSKNPLPSQADLRIVYEDSDIWEFQATLLWNTWGGLALAYEGRGVLTQQAARLFDWCRSPEGIASVKLGSQESQGMIQFDFYEVDKSGAKSCRLQLLNWREVNGKLDVELPTETGLIERFAKEALHLEDRTYTEATLQLLPREIRC